MLSVILIQRKSFKVDEKNLLSDSSEVGIETWNPVDKNSSSEEVAKLCQADKLLFSELN